MNDVCFIETNRQERFLTASSDIIEPMFRKQQYLLLASIPSFWQHPV
jgi:hypothetical protein